jgi:hypothetical protein
LAKQIVRAVVMGLHGEIFLALSAVARV